MGSAKSLTPSCSPRRRRAATQSWTVRISRASQGMPRASRASATALGFSSFSRITRSGARSRMRTRSGSLVPPAAGTVLRIQRGSMQKRERPARRAARPHCTSSSVTEGTRLMMRWGSVLPTGEGARGVGAGGAASPSGGGWKRTPRWGSLILPRPVGQRLSTGQAAQSGRRASQTRRPWKISWWCSSIQSSWGKVRQRSASTFSGVLALDRPRRRATRKMWVSTARAGTPKALASTTLAVFWPTPGRAPRAAGSAGTSPPWRAIKACPRPMRFRALLW